MDAIALLKENETKDLLRFVTCGSVDDGKSTLIGRLLFESKGIYEDQLASVKNDSKKYGTTGDQVDLALLTDGLKSEREQGITIDVAYRYFSTPKRKFIIADSPGHEQYTRNMATGASTASAAIILVDASQGLTTQSKRHAFITALLGIPHLVVAVNKMDLVDYSQDVYEKIVSDFTAFATRLDVSDVEFIPISALKGDNVVEKSSRTDWYDGRTLLRHLEMIHIASDRNLVDFRLPVQYVCRPNSDFRGYMGTPSSGVVRAGDEVIVLPSGMTTKVQTVRDPAGPVEAGFPPLPLTIELEDDVDVSRGDLIAHVNNQPKVEHQFEGMLVWMASQKMIPGKQYLIKHLTRIVPATVTKLLYQVDVNTLHRKDSEGLGLNEIGRCSIETARPIIFDPYKRNRTTGAFIVIDRQSHNTVAAGMILEREPDALRVHPERRVETAKSQNISATDRSGAAGDRGNRFGQKPVTLWLTGLSGSGKSSIAFEMEQKLLAAGHACCVLDGENVRAGISKDLGFSADDRAENIRRVAEMARVINDSGLIAICSLLSPYEDERERARQIVGPQRFLELYVSTPVQVCRKRVPELYEKADSGQIPHFSGVTAPYEAPLEPDLELPAHRLDLDQCVQSVLDMLRDKQMLKD
ncbi:MAG: sulfate adenylyltransferase subunit CysN [Phycisphaerae bacterium]